jgi:hypothetical protein
MKRLLVAVFMLLGCVFTARAHATTDASNPRPKNLALSPIHLGATAELLAGGNLGGTLVDVPLTLYGAGAEVGYRFVAPNGVVGTPYFAGHLMRGNTPAGLLFTSAGWAGGFDVAYPSGRLALHVSGELGRTTSTFSRASKNMEEEVTQFSGQLLVGCSYRVSPWFALRAGIGYRSVGQVVGSAFVVGVAI